MSTLQLSPPAGSLPPHCPRFLRLSRPSLLQLLLLLVLSPLALTPPCLCAVGDRLHNVWYGGLFISGITVDESTGDVYFSDAASNRVVRQSVNGTVLHIYDQYGFYSPTQLIYYQQMLYVADSTNNRVGWIDVRDGGMTWAPTPSALTSCTAMALNLPSMTLYVVDGWGLMMQPYDLLKSAWGKAALLYNQPIPPRYISSVGRLLRTDRMSVYLPDPLTGRMFCVLSADIFPVFGLNASGAGVSAIYQSPGLGIDLNYTFFVLSQPAVDQPMTITQLDGGGKLMHQWQAHGRGGAAIPFIGWAMYVDSSRNMYISDHGVDAESSPYGRVVKLASNGTELGEWSMSDGVAYSFTGILYDASSASGGSCALWMTERERGLVRIATDGTVLQPQYLPPTDPADGRSARFTGVADGSWQLTPSSAHLVLLDTSDPSTTKLWRFSLVNRTYTLLNTTAAQLGANISGVAVDPVRSLIWVSDTSRRTVVCLLWTGELSSDWDASAQGFVEPAGMVLVKLPAGAYPWLYVTDSGYNTTGAVLMLDSYDSTMPAVVLSQTTPPLYRPLCVAIAAGYNWLYVADSNGLLFQYDIRILPPTQKYMYQPIPAANSIVSMQVSDSGDVYLVDVHSHRLIIKLYGESRLTSWSSGKGCLPPMSDISSSSSSSSSTAPLALSSSSSSSSSTGLVVPGAVGAVLPVAAIAVVIVLGVLAVVGGAGCLYMKRTDRSRNMGERGEQLMAHKQEEEEKRETGMAAKQVADGAVVPHRADVDLSLCSGSSGVVPSRASRYDYYVARYEVAALAADVHEGLLSLEARRRIRPSILVSAATSRSTTSASSRESTSDSSASTSSSRSVSAVRVYSPASASLSNNPRHIARIESTWQTVPHFIDAVNDLTILGEGSSGLVYSGTYDGVACVVKLPKSAALTGAAWREWQCHLRLPPHPHVVRFLGALPMSSTNYLVTALVRQGSLHSLLGLSGSCTIPWYGRPYGVIRCLRDISAALHHIHSAGIVHRDVSCRNILVDSDGRMVLADLGLAVQLHDSTQSTMADIQTTAVPVRWTSPEALSSSHYSSQSDVWSLGVAVCEMTAGGRLPYGAQVDTKACIQPIIAQQLVLQVDDTWGRDDSMSEAERRLADIVRRLVQLCLTYEVERRPDSEQLVEAVERWWEEWKAEAGEEAADIEREWCEYHEEVKRRLGPPLCASARP